MYNHTGGTKRYLSLYHAGDNIMKGDIRLDHQKALAQREKLALQLKSLLRLRGSQSVWESSPTGSKTTVIRKTGI